MKKTLRKNLSIIGATFIAAGSLLAFPTAANAAAYTFEVDCNTLEEYDTIFLELGDTLAISTVNCGNGISDWSIDDSDNYDTVLSSVTADIPSGDPIVFTAPSSPYYSFLDNLEFEDDGSYTELDIVVIGIEANPDGTLLDTTDVNIYPLDSGLLDYSTVDVGEVHTVGGESDDCYVIAGEHPYGSVTVTVTEAGEYTFRALDTLDNSLIGVPKLILFSEFDPAQPDDNVVGCSELGRLIAAYSEDGDDLDTFPLYTISLEPGTYTLLALNREYVEDWAELAVGADTMLRVEAWGPEGGLVFNDGLADTGTNSVTPLNGLGFVLILAGAGLLIARRVRTQ